MILCKGTISTKQKYSRFPERLNHVQYSLLKSHNPINTFQMGLLETALEYLKLICASW